MKKVLSFLVLFVLLATFATTVNAVSSNELADKLYELGSPYGMTSSHKLRIERYLADNEVTDDQANQIVAKAEAAVAIMKEAGTTDYFSLTDSQKNQIKSLAVEAADIIGLTLTFSNRTVQIYKDGKLIDTVSADDGSKLAYTGNNTNAILVVSSVAVIALAVGFAARKKFANA